MRACLESQVVHVHSLPGWSDKWSGVEIIGLLDRLTLVFILNFEASPKSFKKISREINFAF